MADVVKSSLTESTMTDFPLWVNATSGGAEVEYDDSFMRVITKTAFQSDGPAVPTTTTLGDTWMQPTQKSGAANYSVDIAAGYYVVGDYLVIATGTTNITVPSPTGSTQQHIGIIQIVDSGIPGSTPHWEFQVLEGTGGAPRSVPVNASKIFTVTAVSGASSYTNSVIADNRPMRRGAGQIIGGRVYAGSGTLATGIAGSDVYFGMTSGAVNIRAGYRYRVDVRMVADTTVNDTALVADIREDDGGTHLTGVKMGEAVLHGMKVGIGHQFTFNVEFTAATTKTVTYALTGYAYWRPGGTGTCQVNRRAVEADSPRLTVRELGPAAPMSVV